MRDVKKLVRVDVVSDAVCPWCYVGKKRLDAAIERVADRFQVQVAWNPFQLSPELPPEGRDWKEYANERFGSLDRMKGMQERIVEVGREVGIPFAFDKISRAANTFDAHRLLWLAGDGADQNEMAERIFRAYFVEGEDIGSRDTLVRIAGEAGMDEGKVREALEAEAGKEEIRFGLEEARQVGVQAVPFFIVNNRFAVSGAQSEDVLVELFERAASAAE